MKAALLALTLILSSCGTRPPSEAEQRLRRHFQFSNSVDLYSEPSPLLSRVPVGTAEQEVYSYLEQAGIGKDGLSSYTFDKITRSIVGRIDYDVNSPGLVKESFGVYFYLDVDRRVRGAKIERWLTGP